MRLPSWLPSFASKMKVLDSDSLYIYASQRDATVVMVTMLGVDDSMMEEIISVTSRKFSGKHRIIYITNSLDFRPLRKHSAMFEYLPPLSEQKLHAEAMPWPAYLQARWQLLNAKWKPIHILAYGQNIERYLAAATAAAVTKTRRDS
jgi:hypothetical protein